MSLQIYIRAQIQRLFSMAKGKDQRTVRFSPAVADAIDQLVLEGKYASFTDFMNRAAHELLYFERMKETLRTMVQEEIKKQM